LTSIADLLFPLYLIHRVLALAEAGVDAPAYPLFD